MKLVFLYVIIAGMGFAACDVDGRKSRYKLTDEQLAHVMLDMALSEAALAGLEKEQADSLKHLFRRRLTDIYGLSETELQQQIRKLETDPDKLNLVMGRMRMIADSLR